LKAATEKTLRSPYSIASTFATTRSYVHVVPGTGYVSGEDLC
jgi:hypothetical protein